jgi:hypothetical protein
MNKIRNIILAIAIVLLSSVAFGEEPANKPGENKDPIIGHNVVQGFWSGCLCWDIECRWTDDLLQVQKR